MPRDSRAYLRDILDCCEAITAAVDGVSLEDYRQNRIVRRAVEREFTVIGEAVLALSHRFPEVFLSITHARRIVDFRNQLTHQYPSVNDDIVWGIAMREVPTLTRECSRLLDGLVETKSSS